MPDAWVRLLDPSDLLGRLSCLFGSCFTKPLTKTESADRQPCKRGHRVVGQTGLSSMALGSGLTGVES